MRSVNRLRTRFVIEENAVMIAYEIHVVTSKAYEKRSVPYPRAARADDRAGVRRQGA